MTNSGEMSVKMSMKARGLLGSVGGPGLGSSTTRTAPIREKVGPKELPRPRWRINRPLALRLPGRPAHAATSCSVPGGLVLYSSRVAVKHGRVRHQRLRHAVPPARYGDVAGDGSEDGPS